MAQETTEKPKKPGYLADKQAQVDALRALVETGDLNDVKTLQAITQKALDMGNLDTDKLFSKETLNAITGDDGKSANVLKSVQDGDFSSIGKMLGLDDEKQRLLEKATGDYDINEVSRFPGVLVDRESGKASFLGVIPLDPDNPISRYVAQGASTLYGFMLNGINANIMAHRYTLAKPFIQDAAMDAAAKHKVALGIGVGLTALASYWSNITSVVQMRQQHDKDRVNLAQDLAPVLDIYRGGSHVSDLYSVSADTNELIANERRRLSTQQRAEYASQAVAVLQFTPQFLFGLRDGLKHAPMNEAALNTAQTALEIEQNKWSKIADQAKLIHKQFDGNISMEQATKLAHSEINGQLDKLQAHLGEGPLTNLMKSARDGTSAAWSGAINTAASWVYDGRTTEISDVTARDMIDTLKKQLDHKPDQERYQLPDKMSVKESDGDNRLPLANYILEIFRQHEKDTYGKDADIPERSRERLYQVCKQIAQPLREGKLDASALFMLVGERHIVRRKGRDIAPDATVTRELDRLMWQLRHVDMTDRRQWEAESAYTVEQVRESWPQMDADERALLTLTTPQSFLIYAGIPRKEIEAANHQVLTDQQNVYAQMSTLLDGLAHTDAHELEQVGTTHSERALFKDAGNRIKHKGAESIEPLIMRSGSKPRELTHAISNLLISNETHHMGMVEKLLGKEV